ncbi:MAG: DUF924 domain-containing protein [Gammaproteobacteria bacterium]|nr:DUF924 domain-containing protein [Gammaproteobacteria bacterium]
MSATEIIKFCFTETHPNQWLKNDPEFDQIITNQFLDVHQLAQKGLLFNWREHPLDALAEIILLDQFSRNIFQNSPKAYQFDDLALVLAQEAIRKKYDAELTTEQRKFLYSPFMHSESKEIHELAVFLYDQPGLEESYHRELYQKEIIDCFDRFPERNITLNRKSTVEELVFLSNLNTPPPRTSRPKERHPA